MAQRGRMVDGNAPGAVFVDDSCIHCGTCFHFQPHLFVDAGDTSRVDRQPASATEHHQAALAQIACPTGSIGGAADPTATFPIPWTAGVDFCGWTSPKSFGAWSWLLTCSLGRVLIDCPRAAGPLMHRLADDGGIDLHVLTHIDDVADHEAFHQRFGCDRLIHADEPLAVERQVHGDQPVQLAEDVLIIPTPGHTQGSICILYDQRVLFTGDSLWWNPKHRSLSASKTHCWHDWDLQVTSLERLMAYSFTTVLPAHGAPHHRESAAAMQDDLAQAIARLKDL